LLFIFLYHCTGQFFRKKNFRRTILLKKGMKYIFNLFIISFLQIIYLNAQSDSSALVKYTPSFVFNEGFFLHFDQVKSNAPIPPWRVVFPKDYKDPDFFDAVIENKKLVYYDDLGIKHETSTDQLWGYSRKGSLYINVNGTFNRINIVGSICHFIAVFRVYQPSYYDPFVYGPYYSGIGYNLRMGSSGYESAEVKQLILDFETGKLYEYSLESLELIFSRDPELYAEFSALKKKQKKQLKFVYLRKYNDRHPLYFPAGNETQ